MKSAVTSDSDGDMEVLEPYALVQMALALSEKTHQQSKVKP